MTISPETPNVVKIWEKCQFIWRHR